MRFTSILILLLAASNVYAQPGFKSRLDSFFAGQPAGKPGFALSIQKDGKTVYCNTSGVANINTLTPIESLTNFRMASVTKQFTAMGILLLEKEGVVRLDDPVGRWLPELPAGVGRHVLIRHLLTHTSGILDYESLIPSTQTTQVLDADVLQLLSRYDSTYFPPGSRFQYSNSGFCLLALIIERASKKTFPEFTRERIFVPLHMDSSTVYETGHYIAHRAMGYPADQSITSATKGDGGVYTSLCDYAKWINALQNNTLLPLAAALRKLRFPLAKSNQYYAAGWFLDDNNPRLLFHSGSSCGFNNFVILIPGDSLSIVCFSNVADNSAPFRAILTILKNSGYPDLTSVFALEDQTR